MENAPPVAPVERIVSQPFVLPLDSIVCGDNVATMATFPDACIDLVVTSPPYDNLRTYGGHSWDFEGVAQQLWRVIKPGGVVVWVVADATVNGSETGTSFRQALRFMDIGFRLHDTMIWEKPNPGVCGDRYAPSWEFMFVFSFGHPKAFVPIMQRNANAGKRTPTSQRTVSGNVARPTVTIKEESVRSNIWYFPTGGGPKAAEGTLWCEHPAMFPEALARDHILSWSNENDIVLDPFSGSGTTAKMARLMGRRYIGIEINPEYCEIARKRLAQKVFEFAVDNSEEIE